MDLVLIKHINIRFVEMCKLKCIIIVIINLSLNLNYLITCIKYLKANQKNNKKLLIFINFYVFNVSSMKKHYNSEVFEVS